MRRTKAMRVGCPDDDTFGALVAGTLPPDEREAIAIHAATCESCHEVLAGLTVTAASGEDEGETLVLRPGTQLGRFTVAERLGIGGMGVVYAATDDELERRVALKLLRPERAGHDARARLVREARTLARLAHPNIVTVFDVGEHRGNVYVVMELIEGGSIAAWCARQPRTSAEIVAAMIEAGRGLAAAHAAGFVHRDVKPDNILLGHDGRARVTDFGLARVGETSVEQGSAGGNTATQLTRTGTLLGTPVYMAPEAVLGETSERADQWAFCASLYELLGGVRPFPVEPVERAAAIASGRLQAPQRRIPAHVLDVIKRGLRADPEARWPSMVAVVGALQRKRRTLLLGIGVAVALGSGVAIAAWPADPVEPELAAPVIHDQREGCGCPYSACTTHCVSVCKARAFSIGEPLPGLNVTGQQEAPVGLSADGRTVLFLSGRRCGLDRLYLGRQYDSLYARIDLTPQLDPRVAVRESCCTLSSDASSLILVADRKRFVEARLDGDRVLPAVALFDPELPSHVTVRAPVLSADRRTLYYRVDDTDANGDGGPLDGIYLTERESADRPFGNGHRITGPARRFEYVTGESSDGLTLFITYEFGTRVLVRSTKREAFNYPAPWQAFWMLGFRAIPTGDCRRVLITSTPGGCESEDVRFLHAVD